MPLVDMSPHLELGGPVFMLPPDEMCDGHADGWRRVCFDGPVRDMGPAVLAFSAEIQACPACLARSVMET